MTIPSNMDAVAQDGELILYATKDQKYGILYNSRRGTQSERQSLQVFFKWGNFEAIDNGETETAET